MLHIAWWWDASSLLACFEGSNGGGKEESSSGSGMQRLRSSSERKRPETFFFFSFWRPLNYQSVGEWEPASREVIIPQCVWNLVNARRKPRSFFYTSGRAAQQQRNFFHQMLRRCLIDKKGGEQSWCCCSHCTLYCTQIYLLQFCNTNRFFFLSLPTFSKKRDLNILHFFKAQWSVLA